MIRECPIAPGPACQGLLRAAQRHLRAGDLQASVDCLLESWRLAPAQLWILALREDLLVGMRNGDACRLVERKLAERIGGAALPSIQVLVDCRDGVDGIEATLAHLVTRDAEIDAVLLLPENAIEPARDPRVRVIRCRDSGSGLGPWNAAISSGNSPLVVALRSGEHPEPGLLDRMAERFLVSGRPQLLLCDGIGDDGTPVAAGGFTALQLAWRCGLPRWTAFSREAWSAAGGFDPDLDPEMSLRDFWLFCAGADGRGEKITRGRMVVRARSATVPPRRLARDWETVVERRSRALTPQIRRTAAALLIQEAQSALAQGCTGEALPSLESACALLPGESRLLDMRNRLRRECQGGWPADPREALEAAGALIQQGQVDAALEALDSVIARGVDIEEVWHSKAWILVQSGRMGEARAALRQALLGHPRDVVALECLMDLDLQRGAAGEAAASASRLLGIEPDHDRAKVVLRAAAGV